MEHVQPQADNTQQFRSAIITIAGRPNSGKSTLINTIIGEEVSIATPLPQTTRLNARGIYTTDSMQLVFVDTPGIHQGKHALNHAMLEEARYAIDESSDLLCYLVDSSRSPGDEETLAATLVASVKNIPKCIIFNKIDLCSSPDTFVSQFFNLYPSLCSTPSLSIAATSPEAKQQFLKGIDRFLKPGPYLFNADDITDSTMRQIAAEYIRKYIIINTQKEVPHAVFVEIDTYKEVAGRHSITATIHVETRGQRGILVGKEGATIKHIKKSARQDLEQLIGVSVSLTCHVKVSPHWRNNAAFLQMMGIHYRH